MALTLGIDVACRAAHQATLAVDGKTVWRGRKFWTRPADLERLWDDLDLAEPGELTVVVEPTRNAWIVVAEWFRRRGATVAMVPTTQSSDLRKYYSKHTKNDRIDSELLARLPLLHPEGLRPYSGQGPADPLRRLTRQRSTMVKRRTAVYATSTTPRSPRPKAARSSRTATNSNRAAATTSGTSGCANAASRRRARSHRSRKALQHPSPPPPSLRAAKWLDVPEELSSCVRVCCPASGTGVLLPRRAVRA